MSEGMQSRVQAVRTRMNAAQAESGRPQTPATLMAVSKDRPASAIRAAASAGVTDVGENYVREALDKHDALADVALTWHFIGPLQANKTRPVAERFDWVHSVDRERLGQRLAHQRPPAAGALNICVQVNIDGESSKAGVTPEAAPELVAALAALPALRVRGLMAIPARRSDPRAQREPFACVAALLRTLQERFPALPLDTLSMGMSEDLEAALAEGATIVRIGSALFGPRTRSH